MIRARWTLGSVKALIVSGEVVRRARSSTVFGGRTRAGGGRILFKRGAEARRCTAAHPSSASQRPSASATYANDSPTTPRNPSQWCARSSALNGVTSQRSRGRTVTRCGSSSGGWEGSAIRPNRWHGQDGKFSSGRKAPDLNRMPGRMTAPRPGCGPGLDVQPGRGPARVDRTHAARPAVLPRPRPPHGRISTLSITVPCVTRRATSSPFVTRAKRV